MTATEKARRAESLYQDRAKRELADMVVHREADLEDAKAESEHMRLKALAVTGELQEENERLKADNAKLRELVKRMFDRVNYECRCCSVFCSDWDEDNECCVFTALMRELGVEVDDD